MERRQARKTTTIALVRVPHAEQHKFLVQGVVYQAYNNDDFSLAGRDLLKDECLAQLQHDVGLFKELGINTLYICRSGVDSVCLVRCMLTRKMEPIPRKTIRVR
jgi:hypothetical protein